jgi:AraC-like DNA-binding protein
MGPIRYLSLQRMHLVRQALQRADIASSTVTKIATDYGFWQLGHFSTAYRVLFGETPSETLLGPIQHRQLNLRPLHRFDESGAPR